MWNDAKFISGEMAESGLVIYENYVGLNPDLRIATNLGQSKRRTKAYEIVPFEKQTAHFHLSLLTESFEQQPPNDWKMVFNYFNKIDANSYLMQKNTNITTSWSCDLGYISVVASVIYGYAIVVFLAFYFLLQYQDSNVSLVRFWCMWSYSPFICILQVLDPWGHGSFEAEESFEQQPPNNWKRVFNYFSKIDANSYLMQKNTNITTSWSCDLGYISVAASVIYGYAIVASLTFYFLLRYQDSNVSLVRFWCMWSYSPFICIPQVFDPWGQGSFEAEESFEQQPPNNWKSVFNYFSKIDSNSYLMHKNTNITTSWSCDLVYISVVASVIYGYAIVVSLAFYFLLQYQDSNVSLVRFWGMWSYSPFICIP
ncbi:hypothetical protein GQ457_05G015300 [Hibiscus cannabinus]